MACKASQDICLNDVVSFFDLSNDKCFISTEVSREGPSSIDNLFIIFILNTVLVLYNCSCSSSISVYPINIVSSILDKEHIVCGTCIDFEPIGFS